MPQARSSGRLLARAVGNYRSPGLICACPAADPGFPKAPPDRRAWACGAAPAQLPAAEHAANEPVHGPSGTLHIL
eukprot:14515915-Alexandrium_andersonii.AAC.1